MDIYTLTVGQDMLVEFPHKLKITKQDKDPRGLAIVPCDVLQCIDEDDQVLVSIRLEVLERYIKEYRATTEKRGG